MLDIFTDVGSNDVQHWGVFRDCIGTMPRLLFVLSKRIGFYQ